MLIQNGYLIDTALKLFNAVNDHQLLLASPSSLANETFIAMFQVIGIFAPVIGAFFCVSIVIRYFNGIIR